MAGYRNLQVWQLAIDISLKIYQATSSFPQEERFGLSSQLRRASVSIASNIAEGHARKAQKEFRRFLHLAKGSLAEVETQLIISSKLNYLSSDVAEELFQLTEQESRMLSGLIGSLGE